MSPYTVLLLRPDHVAVVFGHDTYQLWVTADSAEEAIRLAQIEAIAIDFAEEPDGNPDDYFVLACYMGHLRDLNEWS